MYPAQYRALAGFLVASAVFVAIFVALTLSAFHRPAPHDLPVGIVGPAAVTRQVEHALDGAAPGAFRFRSYPSEASATTGIAQREVDGALVVSGANLRLLVTQAGGTGPEQALSGAFTAVAARSGRHPAGARLGRGPAADAPRRPARHLRRPRAHRQRPVRIRPRRDGRGPR